VKFGYSQYEVWDWLNNEDVGQSQFLNENFSVNHLNNWNESIVDSKYSQVKVKSFEVKFSALEFLSASSRLSPLDIEGLENFVSVMLEKAIDEKHQSNQNERLGQFLTLRARKNSDYITNDGDSKLLIIPLISKSSEVKVQQNPSVHKDAGYKIHLDQIYQPPSHHNYQTLLQIDQILSGNCTRAYTSLEAVYQNINGKQKV